MVQARQQEAKEQRTLRSTRTLLVNVETAVTWKGHDAAAAATTAVTTREDRTTARV